MRNDPDHLRTHRRSEYLQSQQKLFTEQRHFSERLVTVSGWPDLASPGRSLALLKVSRTSSWVSHGMWSPDLVIEGSPHVRPSREPVHNLCINSGDGVAALEPVRRLTSEKITFFVTNRVLMTQRFVGFLSGTASGACSG